MTAAELRPQAMNTALEGAMLEANGILAHAENFALMLAELDLIDLPGGTHAEPMQLRAIASLYLASALESAGLIWILKFVPPMRSMPSPSSAFCLVASVRPSCATLVVPAMESITAPTTAGRC